MKHYGGWLTPMKSKETGSPRARGPPRLVRPSGHRPQISEFTLALAAFISALPHDLLLDVKYMRRTKSHGEVTRTCWSEAAYVRTMEYIITIINWAGCCRLIKTS
jgi:hypothetical protein